MSSNPLRPKGKPPAVDELRGTVADLERTLAEVQRMRNTTYTSLPGLMAAGDAEALADARTEVAKADRFIREKTEELETAREALKIALQSAHAEMAAENYRTLERIARAAADDAGALEDATVAFARALDKARRSAEAVDTLQSSIGVAADPYLLRVKVVPVTEMRLHRETGGVLGTARTLDSPDQLRANGRDSLKRLAFEFKAVTLQRARAALGIKDPTPPRAA